ncbi:MAG: hypothetical protein H6572_12150 [Lewinellaceae bacterium]|nr:hypothetical protein [Lewinellaceae bacterium]
MYSIGRKTYPTAYDARKATHPRNHRGFLPSKVSQTFDTDHLYGQYISQSSLY